MTFNTRQIASLLDFTECALLMLFSPILIVR
jgi:hypothetical protein